MMTTGPRGRSSMDLVTGSVVVPLCLIQWKLLASYGVDYA